MSSVVKTVLIPQMVFLWNPRGSRGPGTTLRELLPEISSKEFVLCRKQSLNIVKLID